MQTAVEDEVARVWGDELGRVERAVSGLVRAADGMLERIDRALARNERAMAGVGHGSVA